MTKLQAGDRIYNLDGSPAQPQDFITDIPIVFILHGFTADSKYLADLGKYLDGSGFSVFFFDYQSYVGIDYAAQSLRYFVHHYDVSTGGFIKRNGVFLEPVWEIRGERFCAGDFRP